MGPLYCPRCRRPWYACTCRRKSEELPEKIDCSFICMPAFLNFDKEKNKKDMFITQSGAVAVKKNGNKNSSEFGGSTFGGSTFGGNDDCFIRNESSYVIESQCSDKMFDSTGPTRVYDPNENIENTDPNVPNENNNDDDDYPNDLVEGVDEEFLNGFLDEKKESVVYNHEMENKRNFIRRKLDFCKKFYFDANDQLLLNHRSFLRYSGITTFDVGYAWKNKVDKMDKIELLCQLVNEVNQIKACCLQLYYRESAVSVSKGRREKLVKKYIGIGHEKDFNESVEREVKEFVWFLKTYKKRYLDVKDRVMKVLGLDEEFLKSIKTFEDVYDYFIYHLDTKNGQFNVV